MLVPDAMEFAIGLKEREREKRKQRGRNSPCAAVMSALDMINGATVPCDEVFESLPSSMGEEGVSAGLGAGESYVALQSNVSSRRNWPWRFWISVDDVTYNSSMRKQ